MMLSYSGKNKYLYLLMMRMALDSMCLSVWINHPLFEAF